MINIKKIIFFEIFLLILIISPLKIQGAFLEGGSNFENAVEMTPGSYESEEMIGGQIEYFFVNLKAGQYLQIEANLEPMGAGIGGIILYDEDRLPLVKREELVQVNPATFKISYLLNSKKASYKIYIKKYCGLFSLGTFSINLATKDFYDALSKTDAPETFEKAIDIFYGKYKGYFSGDEGNDKKDFYKISITQKGSLMLVVTPLTKTAKILATIYDSEKNVIAEKSGGFGKEIKTSRYLTKLGDYFIKIEGSSSEIIPYSFEISAKEAEVEVEKKSFFETLNLKFIFGIIFLIIVLSIAGKIIYSLLKK